MVHSYIHSRSRKLVLLRILNLLSFPQLLRTLQMRQFHPIAAVVLGHVLECVSKHRLGDNLAVSKSHPPGMKVDISISFSRSNISKSKSLLDTLLEKYTKARPNGILLPPTSPSCCQMGLVRLLYTRWSPDLPAINALPLLCIWLVFVFRRRRVSWFRLLWLHR